MNPLIAALNGLSSAEEIFGHFGLPFDPAVVNVNRLHILKRFNQYLGRAGGLDGMETAEARRTARELLERAYQDFVNSSAVEQKVFKVFRQGSTQRISVEALHGSRAMSDPRS
jgi:nitrogenase-stabilizing/protective protein